MNGILKTNLKIYQGNIYNTIGEQIPYNFVQNNPLLKTDPDGKLDGDYYDMNHNYLGNDGIDDNRVYVVYNKPPPSVDQFTSGAPAKTTITYVGQTTDVFKTGDKGTDQKIASLHPAIRWKATDFMNDANAVSDVKIIMAQGLRTFEEQDGLYAKGRTEPGGIITKAKGGQSNHNYGLAFDIAGVVGEGKNQKITYDLNWFQLKRVGSKNGLDWGGDWKTFKDKPHFENMIGNTLKELRKQYNVGNRNGPYINLSN